MKIVRKSNLWLPSIIDELFPENRLDSINYERFSIPLVNIKEDFSTFVIELAVPGLKKEDIAIEEIVERKQETKPKSIHVVQQKKAV